MSKGYGVFGHVPDNADDDGSCLMRMMIPAFPGAMRCVVAILGKEETTKMPITTTVGMT